MEEIDFKWDDCDSQAVELSEFYTYSELDDFAMNYEAFARYMRNKKVMGGKPRAVQTHADSTFYN